MFDRRFVSISLIVQGIANAPVANPTAGTQYIVGATPTGAFANATPNYIARYDGAAWKFTPPKISEIEVLNANTGEILSWNGTLFSLSFLLALLFQLQLQQAIRSSKLMMLNSILLRRLILGTAVLQPQAGAGMLLLLTIRFTLLTARLLLPRFLQTADFSSTKKITAYMFITAQHLSRLAVLQAVRFQLLRKSTHLPPLKLRQRLLRFLTLLLQMRQIMCFSSFQVLLRLLERILQLQAILLAGMEKA